ncbi:MAG TPA: GGDEF domain-containing protein, partial [Pseudorhizobium sp.]|nr:GGDEF domain-containing protein [Pseudorhizobium sp.]
APPGAVVGRLGGEEFGLLLPRMSVEAVVPFAENLRLAIAALAVPGLPKDFRTTASFGVALWDPETTLAHNLQRADAALYEAKKAGRNRVKVHVPEGSAASAAAQ